MIRSIALLVLAASLSMVAPAVSASSDPISDELVALNNKMQLATLHYDRATVDKMMTDDFRFVGHLGLVFSREAFLTDLADRSYTFDENTPTQTLVKHYNDDCALVTGVLHIRAHKGAKVIDQTLRYGDVWVKRNGSWLWAYSQTARIK